MAVLNLSEHPKENHRFAVSRNRLLYTPKAIIFLLVFQSPVFHSDSPESDLIVMLTKIRLVASKIFIESYLLLETKTSANHKYPWEFGNRMKREIASTNKFGDFYWILQKYFQFTVWTCWWYGSQRLSWNNKRHNHREFSVEPHFRKTARIRNRIRNVYKKKARERKICHMKSSYRTCIVSPHRSRVVQCTAQS